MGLCPLVGGQRMSVLVLVRAIVLFSRDYFESTMFISVLQKKNEWLRFLFLAFHRKEGERANPKDYQFGG